MKKLFVFLPLLLLVASAAGSTVTAALKKGQNKHGFKLIEKRFVKEVNAECYLFEHVKSGARLLKIASDDPNKTFSIAFKTVPESDCGTPHIMEHSVLNGSKNFPVKSPFDVLYQGSLNTFLNAMTGSYITIYPVASMNDKDYFNLMHVYLDAVLNPLIYDDPRILKQEGWHYELMHVDSALEYKGVVYNEMKGAFSNPRRVLGYHVDKNLFPDNPFGFSSGGYPPAIPTLTYEDFLNYHRRYYHPDNSYILLYGNADLEKELAFIDKEYLSNYEKQESGISFPVQKPFKKLKKVEAFYAVPEESSTEDQTYLSLNWVTGLSTDRANYMAFDILTDVLVNQESGPVRLALQEAGIGKEVNAYVDENKQSYVNITVQNANPEDSDKFLDIVTQTLKETVKNGLDKKALEGTINRLEFRLREGDDAQKGLTYNFQAISGWFFADDPFLSLEYEKPLAVVKQSLKNDYLEKLIQKHMIDNTHALLLTLAPKPGLEAEVNKLTEEELAKHKASLSQEALEAIAKETSELIEYQKREDSPEALETIPLLSLSDINPEVQWYEVAESGTDGIPTLHHETFTNNVVYVDLYFDARVLPDALVPYGALLSEVLGSLNTENYDFGDLDNELNIHTGGFNTNLRTYLENRNDEQMLPKFVVSSKSMTNKVDKMFELIEEILNNTKYGDKDRLKDVLTRHQSRLDSQVKQNGFGYTRTRLLSYFSNNGAFNEKVRGIDYYWFVTGLVDEFDDKADEVIANLSKAATLLFNKDNLIAACTSEKKQFAAFSKGLKNLTKSLPDSEVRFVEWTFDPKPANEGMLSASKVQYVLKGYDFKKLGYEWNGKMRVLNKVLSSDWLQNQIRVIGGAYGGFSSFSNSGQVYFASYRDPNLKETLDNYDNTPEYLSNFDADERDMTRYIIGTIAQLDRPLTPSQKGDAAARYFFEKTSRSDLQKDRSAILSTSAQDIRDMEKMVADILSQNAYCVYGNEGKIKEEKDLFRKIVTLSK